MRRKFFTFNRSRFVLLIGDEGVMLAAFGGDHSALPIFAAACDEAARQAIAQRLRDHPQTPVTLLVNGAAQEFRRETLPPVNSLDRRKLVRQRLKQAFPEAYAASSRFLDSTDVFLAALRRGDAVAPWIAALPSEKFQLGLLPVECAAFVTHLEPEAKKGWAILVAHFRTGGLRQIVTCDGRLMFTRQTQAASSDEALRSLIADTRGYLARFGLTEAMPLRVLHAGEDGQGSDALFAAFVAARRRLWLPMLPPLMQRRQRQAWMARFGMRAACWVLALALAANVGEFGNLVFQLYKNHSASTELLTLREQLVMQEAALAPAAQPLGRLRAALERQRFFAEPQPQPWNLLRQLGDGLQGKARLTSLEWHDDDTLRVNLRLDAATNAAPPNRDVIVQSFKDCAETLARGMPDYKIEVTRYPFPATPQETLTNSGSDGTGDLVTAELTLRRRP